MRVEDESCQQHPALRFVIYPVFARFFELGAAVVQVAAAGVYWRISSQAFTLIQQL